MSATCIMTSVVQELSSSTCKQTVLNHSISGKVSHIHWPQRKRKASVKVSHRDMDKEKT